MLESISIFVIVALGGVVCYLLVEVRSLELDIEFLTECRDELIRKEISTRLNYTELECKYNCLVEENNKLKEQIKNK